MPQETDHNFLPQGALIEFQAQGKYVRVSAMDPVSLTEVFIVGDARLSEASLERQVIKKLKKMIQKNRQANKKKSSKRNNSAKKNLPRSNNPPSGWEL